MPKDPVCGMDVQEEAAAGTAEHAGHTFYFCSPGCQTEFQRDPHRYAHHGAAAGPADEEDWSDTHDCCG